MANTDFYDEFKIAEIAWRMHYSNVAHLSIQFRNVTGLTPAYFKKLKSKKHITLNYV
jgi:AraC-like DNA-binding protein